MALTAAGQRRLLITIGEAAGPVALAALRTTHPDLAPDVGRGVMRLAITSLAEMRRQFFGAAAGSSALYVLCAVC